jgi:hypothetical protein
MQMRIGLFAGILAVMTGLVCVPVAAAPKERRSSEPRAGSEPPSLDGRTTGQPRTCGYDTFVYSSSGGTVGPYCH